MASSATGRSLIVSDPAVMLGKLVIAGTRITVEHIIRELAAGVTIGQLIQDHPHLTREQVQVAIDFAVAASARPFSETGELAST